MKKKPITFCIKCYSNETYFIKDKPESPHITMRCSRCNSYIKFATKEDCYGKEIINLTNKKLF